MHITRPLSFVFKQTTKVTTKKLISSTLSIAIIAGGVLAYQNLTPNHDQAMAATPPDFCFA